MRCNVCAAPLAQPLYESPAPRSLTSMGQVIDKPHRVHLCGRCGHLQTPPLENLASYYDTGYRILAQSEEQDQIYDVGPDGPIYRTEHQARTLERLVELAPRARVLEYGAGKAATLRHLGARRPDLALHAFDVSRDYQRFWEQFLPAGQFASYELPADWTGKFDLACSFFVLEHLEQPRSALETLRRLLKPSGTLYVVVPNLLENWADFLVAEHINHFHPDALRALAGAAGFDSIEVDEQSHQAALVLTARPGVRGAAVAPAAAATASKIAGLAQYWTRYGERLRAFEQTHAGPSAIYGAGFYGAYLLGCLREPGRVACFVDRNPQLHGKRWQERLIVAPQALGDDVRTLYAGVNPLRAQAILAAVPGWEKRSHELFLP